MAYPLERIGELCAPYQNVVSIDVARLPTATQVRQWSPREFAAAVRHAPRNAEYNRDLRQLLHVAYKIAAEMREEFTGAMESCRADVARNVTANLFERHIRPLFLG